MRLLKIVALIASIPLASLTVPSQELTKTEAQDLLRQASKLVPDIPETQQMSAASNIANAQARAGDTSGALSTVLLLKKPDVQTEVLGSVAYFLDYSGDLDGALKLIGTGANAQTKDIWYTQIACAHANRGDFSQAFRIAHLIQNDPSSSVEALIGIAKAQWKSADHDGAQRTWNEAAEIAKQSPTVETGKLTLLMGIATSRAEVGDTAAASASLNELYRDFERRDPTDQGLRSGFAIDFAQIGELTIALDIIKTLPPDTNRDMPLNDCRPSTSEAG